MIRIGYMSFTIRRKKLCTKQSWTELLHSYRYFSRSFNFQLSNSWLSCSFSCFATYIDCGIVSHPQTGSMEKAAEEKEVQFKCQCGFH